jgi:hypothetical protein
MYYHTRTTTTTKNKQNATSKSNEDGKEKYKMYAQLEDDNSDSKLPESTSKSDHQMNKNGTVNLSTRGKTRNVELEKSLMGYDQEHGRHQEDKSNVHINSCSQTENISSSLMISDDDPFYVFKEDLQIKIELVIDALERYERIIKVTVSLFMSI